LYKLSNEIKKIEQGIQFKDILISDYQKEYLEANYHPFKRPFHLLRKVHEKIKNQGYQRVIYFRPDIKLYYLDNYNADTEFQVTENSIKVLGDHEPEHFWVPENRTMNDLFFVFPWNIFELFLNNAEYICNREIHNSLFEFFEEYKIKVNPIQNMRCVILRNNINESNINLGYQELTNLFLEVMREKDREGKFSFPSQCEISNKTKANLDFIEQSRNNGGILRLRNK
jgi:hypothetical protein